MISLFDQSHGTTIFCDRREHSCVRYAVDDLADDLTRVSGRRPVLMDALPPAGAQHTLLVATLNLDGMAGYLAALGLDPSAIVGKEEHYMLAPFAGGLAVIGSDRRGTMWGIYECCRRYLGVDPLYLWTDHAPVRRTVLSLPEEVLTDGPKTYRFRGWFINDEDLIEGFCRQGTPEKDYRFHGDYGRMLDMLIETALRLKQNMLIPCSHLDIMKPEDEAIVRRVTERGLYISMHHQEPVGVHQFTVDRLWAERGMTGCANLIDHPDFYRQVWQQYIRKWAQYEGVIWQLGLRGRGDRPVWYQNDRAPETIEDRGRLISDAIRMQYDLIREECPEQEVVSTATLWMEGMPLYRAGVLTFPPGTMVIQSDFGPDQMWGEGYDRTPRHADTGYGVYYHLAFWGCGPHLIQGNRPEKIRYNFRQALARGDTSYVVLNVSNVREFVYGIRFEAELTWDIRQDSVEANRRAWCRDEYETEDTAELEAIHQDYFRCFSPMDDRDFPARMTLNDGMSRRVAVKTMQIIHGSELHQEDIQNQRLFSFRSTDDFLAFYREATDAGLARFLAVHKRAVQVMAHIPAHRRRFFEANLLVQIEIMIGLYGWVNALTQAAQNRRSGGSDAAFNQLIAQAVASLDQAIADRRKALYGPFIHWYDGDRLMNLQENRRLTAALCPAARNSEASGDRPTRMI